MYNYKNKDRNIMEQNKYMFARTLSMFDYDELPDSLPSVEIEKQLQMNGFTFITEVNGELFAFTGTLGGQLDVYGNPTQITISNANINFYKTLDIKKDGVLIKNDEMMLGLAPIFDKYNTLLTENEITMYLNTFNTRIQTLISSGDESTKESAEIYLKKIVDGELGIIGENRLFDGINVQNAQTQNVGSTSQLIEFQQYLKASMFNEIGVNANFNMKRERINSSEVEMNTDALHTLIDNMLYNRLLGIGLLNERYNLNANVDYGSIWKTRSLEKEELHEEIEDETKSINFVGIESDDETIIETEDETIIETEDEPESEEIKDDNI